LKSLNKDLKNFVFRIAGEKYHDFVVIRFAWASVVGELQAQRTQLSRYEKNVLFVKVTDHVWRQDLFLSKSKYLEELRAATSIDIHDIKFFT